MKKRSLYRSLAAGLAGLLLLSSCAIQKEPASIGTTGEESVIDETVTDEAVTDKLATTESTTEAVVPTLTVDERYRVVIAAEADAITRNAAERMVTAVREKAGFELTVVTDGEAATDYEIVLGVTNRMSADDVENWCFRREGASLYVISDDSTTLYFAVEAVLEAWLTEDFGLAEEGVLSLPENRIIELNDVTTARDTSIRVLTQNVRCVDDPNGNSIGDRQPRFRKLVMEYRPDLIGVQEDSTLWIAGLNSLCRYLGKYSDLGTYAMVGYTGDMDSRIHWNVILYNTDRFELLDSESFFLSETPHEFSRVEGALEERFCTWALLKDKRTGKAFLYANTHLDHSNDTVRGAQMEILLKHLDEYVRKYPLYLSGDFNCLVDSVPYSNAVSKLQDSHKTAWKDFSTVSNTYHAYTVEGRTEIDFIFHNDRVTPIRYEILSKGYNGFVSDHYGVLVEFVND